MALHHNMATLQMAAAANIYVVADLAGTTDNIVDNYYPYPLDQYYKNRAAVVAELEKYSPPSYM